jgi:hypothetical protein
MLKIVIFHVLYAISVSLTVRGMDVVSGPPMGPTRQWERGKSPSFSAPPSAFTAVPVTRLRAGRARRHLPTSCSVC